MGLSQLTFVDNVTGTIDTLARIWDDESKQLVSVPLTIKLGRGTFDAFCAVRSSTGIGTRVQVSSEQIVVDDFVFGDPRQEHRNLLLHAPIMAEVMERLVNNGILNNTINEVLRKEWRNSNILPRV